MAQVSSGEQSQKLELELRPTQRRTRQGSNTSNSGLEHSHSPPIHDQGPAASPGALGCLSPWQDSNEARFSQYSSLAAIKEDEERRQWWEP